jgi:hypothetical protein
MLHPLFATPPRRDERTRIPRYTQLGRHPNFHLQLIYNIEHSRERDIHIMRAMIHAAVAATLAAGLVAGIAGVAQAQSMPRHDGREIEAVQPNARDMSVRPASTWRDVCYDGFRIRSTPYSTVLGLCQTWHSVTINWRGWVSASDTTTWYPIRDNVTGVSGYVRSDGINTTNW